MGVFCGNLRYLRENSEGEKENIGFWVVDFVQVDGGQYLPYLGVVPTDGDLLSRGPIYAVEQ
jgi:hypothetical protein